MNIANLGLIKTLRTNQFEEENFSFIGTFNVLYHSLVFVNICKPVIEREEKLCKKFVTF